MSRGEIRNLILNQPPGTTKSAMVSILWPAWEWIDRPKTAWMHASFDPSLVLGQSEKLIYLLQSPWYISRFGQKLPPKEVKIAAGEFTTLSGGYRFCTSVAGKGTGRHVDIQVCDDPIKPKDAMGGTTAISKALRNTSNWWRHTMASRRRNPKTFRRVIIMQRLHQSDLAGEMLDTNDYVHLCFPMRFVSNLRCVTQWGGDRRTQDGELLDPNRFPEAEVKALEKSMGKTVAAAQLQQTPMSEGGNIFKYDDYRWYSVLPHRFDEMWQSWDMTFKGSDGTDFVGGCTLGRVEDRFYFLPHFTLERLAFRQSLEAVREMTRVYPDAHTKLIEEKANGNAVEDMLKLEIDGIELIEPKGGKLSRAHAVQPLFDAHCVYFPHPDICPDIVRLTDPKTGQLALFPRGTNDDGVDMLTQGLIYGKMRCGWLSAWG